jgi:hypothetical protein
LFFNLKNDDNGNGFDTYQNCFVATVFAIADLYLKPWIHVLTEEKHGKLKIGIFT